MKTLNGMFTDCQEIDVPQGYAIFIKNALLTNILGAAQNEPGFSIHYDQLPAPVIGVRVIKDSVVFWTTDNETCDDSGYSGIHILGPDKTLTTVIDSNTLEGLNFCRSCPVQAEHYINYAGERVVAFIDDCNVPRIINLDNPQIDDINDLLLFPLAKLPNIETYVNDVGGSLETGTYFITFKYKDIGGGETNWFLIDGPLYVNEERRGAGFTEYDGAPAGTPSSKSITINLTGTDPAYDQIVIGVISEIGGVRSAREISTITNSSNITTVYTGNETYTDITLAEILVGMPSYISAGAITQLNNRLYLGNLETDDLLDYQLYANQIQVNYTTKSINTSILQDGNHKLNGDKGFTPGEVYAFYIAFIMKDGSYSRAYHIPGRAPALVSGGTATFSQSVQQFRAPDKPEWQEATVGSNAFTQAVFPASVLDISDEFPSGSYISFINGANGYYSGSAQYIVDSYYDAGYGQTMVVFQHSFNGNDTGVTVNRTSITNPVYETDISQKAIDRGIGNIPLFRLESTAGNVNAATNMGYWENENENYPLGFPGLDGQPVRHHRMPTLRQLYQGQESTRRGVDLHTIIGIDVSNINIPADISEKVQGYHILFAKKSLSNSLIITHDKLEMVGKATQGENIGDHGPSGGNWTITPIGDSYRQSVDGDTVREPDPYKHVGYALDLIGQFPAVSPDLIDIQYRLKLDNLNTPYTLYNGPGCEVQQGGGTGDNYPSGHALDFGSNSSALLNYLPSESQPIGITNFKYIPGGALDVDINNTRGVSCAYWEVLNDSKAAMTAIPWSTFPNLKPKSPSGGVGDPNFDTTGALTAEIYIISLNSLLTDVHNSLTSQELAATDGLSLGNITEGVASVQSLSDIYNGDCFITYQSVVELTSPTNKDEYWNDASKDLYQNWRFFNAFTAPARNNWNFRHLIQGDPTTWYYPKVDPFDFYDPKAPNTGPRTFVMGDDPQVFNNVEYNLDYSAVNDLVGEGVIIYDPNQRFQTEFPNLIIRSTKQSADALVQSWRTFLPADRYTTERSKGDIINLQGVANEQLIIHLEDSLFITRDRTTLSNTVDASRVSLGAGDIFDLTPKELVTSDKGHAGTQHVFSCKLTKAGYVFTDVKQGKVFLLIGYTDLREISRQHMRNFFRDYMPEDIGDNPFIHDGITVDFDEKYNRIILAFNKEAESFTITYIPEKESWACYHDYQPSILYTMRNNTTFSVNNGYDSQGNARPEYFAVYLHNDEINGHPGVYYNLQDDPVVPYPMIIDIPEAGGTYDPTVFSNIEWSSEVWDKLGNYKKNETFDYLMMRTPTLTTGLVPLAGVISPVQNPYARNIRNTETIWNFNKFRNLSIPGVPFLKSFYDDYIIDAAALNANKMFYQMGRFVDKYAVIRFQYSNVLDRKLLFLDHTLYSRQSIR